MLSDDQETSSQKDHSMMARLDFVHRVEYLDMVIPARVQKGFSTLENVFTCLCATSNYLIVGSNMGIAYVYDRRSSQLHRLRLEGSAHPITCVSCLETVDLMVAIGTSAGLVIVFQIPLGPISCVGESSNVIEQSTIRRYLVTELHRRTIQCLHWSRNGMKLFSGDLEGNVVCTEVDYVMQQCRSTIVLRERDPIFQLDYHQKMLLVSTKRRTLLCSCPTGELGNNSESGMDVSSVQVGQKERKILGNFGACFYAPGWHCGDIVIFVSRPSLRLWKANVAGKVLETFIFKENPPSPTCQVVRVDEDKKFVCDSSFPRSDFQFGQIHLFGDRHLLICSDRQLYVIGVDDLRMVAQCDDLGQILSVANCSADEIFVLNGPRSVVRIANSADTTRFNNSEQLSKSVMGSSKLVSSSLMMMPSHLKDLESKFRDSTLTSALFNKLKRTTISSSKPIFELAQPPDLRNVHLKDSAHVAPEPEGELRSQGKSIEAPEISILVREDARFTGQERDVHKMWAPLPDDNDDVPVGEDDGGALGIVFESKQKKYKKKSAVILNHAHIGDDPKYCLENGMKLDNVENPIKSIGVTRVEKEELLAKILDLEALLPSRPDVAPANSDPGPIDESDTCLLLGSNSGPLDFEKIVEDELANSNKQQHQAIVHPRLVSTKANSMDYEDIYASVHEDQDTSLNSTLDSYLSYGPPSGSSALPSLNSDQPKSAIAAHVSVDIPAKTSMSINPVASDNHRPTDSPSLPSNFNLDTSGATRFTDHWVQHKCPNNVQSLAVCEHYAVCTDSREFVYSSSLDGMGLEWHKMDYQAKQVAVSPTGKRVWRIYRGSAFALASPPSKGPFGSKWIEAALGVSQVSVDDNCIWFVMLDGKLQANCELEDNRCCGKIVPISCPWKVTQVSCFDGIVWILTLDGKLACRIGVSSENPLGIKWNPIDFGGGHISTMTLGMRSIGWIVDATQGVWFKNGLTPKVAPKGIDKKWWQVKISDYVYQSRNTVLQTLTNALRERRFHPDQLVNLLGANNVTRNMCLAATRGRGIWLYNPSDGRLFASASQIVGHHWHMIDLSKRIHGRLDLLSASGVYNDHGGIWMWPDRGQSVCYFNPLSMSVQTCCFPERTRDNPPLCFSAAPETLWLLLDCGGVYIRRGIGIHHPLGSDWIALDLTQIADHKLVHVSCGSDVVWACDSQGGVLMRIGSLEAPSLNCLPPAWVPVVDDDPTLQTAPFFVKVYVGPTSNSVWAIDGKRNVYVREGIFSDLLIGVGWVLVSGVQATCLSISELAVYALTSTGAIFRRFNITSNNYIGDYWCELPGHANLLSVSAHDHLWAVDKEGFLLRHLSHVVAGSTTTATTDSSLRLRKTTSNSVTEDEWEIVNAS